MKILAAEIMEEQIDTEMKKMDELDDDDIEKIRQRRLKAMQKAHQAKQVCSWSRMSKFSTRKYVRSKNHKISLCNTNFTFFEFWSQNALDIFKDFFTSLF